MPQFAGRIFLTTKGTKDTEWQGLYFVLLKTDQVGEHV